MRKVMETQMKLGEVDISKIKIDLRCRDEIPLALLGLQHIYCTGEVRVKVFNILEEAIVRNANPNNGRPGMDLWKILVLGVIRLSCNWDYDKLQEIANNHKTIRLMLGHSPLVDADYYYALQTIKDNVSLFTVELFDRINQVVVDAGHVLVKKKEGKLRGRCDSFVVETDVHYPTDINLLFDAIGKAISLVTQLCDQYGQSGWRQRDLHLRQIKKFYRRAQKSGHSTSKNKEKQQNQKNMIIKVHRAYIERVHSSLEKVAYSVESLRSNGVWEVELAEVERFIAHAERQIDQISRRVFHAETIPHKEKVFSVFQEHTEWISKGKAGVPVELGLRVCVMEDQYQFILHHQVMEKQTDDQVAVVMVQQTQKRFSDFRVCRFDKGFHSPSNQAQLRELLDLSVLPKKGRLSEKDKEREYSPEFVRAGRKHSAVESAINGLEVGGLDRCPDHGIDGFKRYVALAVLSRNIQRLGSIIRKREIRSQMLRARRKKAA